MFLDQKKVGDYTIDFKKRLGSGQFGDVYISYLSSDPSQKFAVKVIMKNRKSTEAEQKKINEEGQNMIRAQGDYIVPLVFLAQSANNIYYFMELCNQGNLAEYIKSKKDNINEAQVLNIFRMLVQGYKDSLYDKNILHRDIKPENILIQNGIPKYGDFGLAKLCPTVEDPIIQSKVGTPLYSSPQLIMQEERQTYQYKADIFSLGILLYYCLHLHTPQNPRDFNDLFKLMTDLKQYGPKKAVVFPEKNRIKVSYETKNCIWSMLEYHEKDRIGIDDLIKHKMFNLISFGIDDEQQNSQAQDDISQSLSQNVRRIQERGTHITKLAGNQDFTKNDEIDKFYIFMRNTAMFSNTVLVNLYNIFKPLHVVLKVPIHKLDRLLMCLSMHYTMLLELLQHLLVSKMQVPDVPYSKEYFSSPQYQFSLNNMRLEYAQSVKQHEVLKKNMMGKMQGAQFTEYADLIDFVENERQIEKVQNEFKKTFKEEVLQKVNQAIINKDQRLLSVPNFLKTIYALCVIQFEQIKLKEHLKFQFESLYSKFNLENEQLVKLIMEI